MEKLKVLELKFPKKKIHPLIISGAHPQNVKRVGDVVVAKWTWWFGDPITPIEMVCKYCGRDYSILEWMDIQETIIFAKRVPSSSWYFVEKVKVRYIPIKESYKWRDHIDYYAQVAAGEKKKKQNDLQGI